MSYTYKQNAISVPWGLMFSIFNFNRGLRAGKELGNNKKYASLCNDTHPL